MIIRLSAQAEPADQALVSAYVFAAEVIQQTTPLGNHRDQTTAGVNVFPVGAEVVGNLADALGEHRHL